MVKTLHDGVISDNLSLESLESLVERLKLTMKRKELLSRHSSPVKQLPNGRWYTRIDGRKIERKSKTDLEAIIIQFYEVETVTINYIFEDYLKRRKQSVSEATWKFDVLYFEQLLKDSEFAKKPVKELTLADGYLFLDYCLKVKPQMRLRYWQNVRVFLNNIMQFCIDNNYILANPIEQMKVGKDMFFKPGKTRDCDTVFTKEEQHRVCSAAEEESERTRNALPLGIVLIFNLGLRVGELCALKWSDIEPGGYIHIQREEVATVNEQGKIRGHKIVEHCKTDAGDRRLLLNKKANYILARVKELNSENGFPVNPNNYIFLRVRKDHLETCTIRCFDPRLRRYCKESGMGVIKSAHDIRRTVLTRLYFEGMPLKKIQEYAGHSTMQQTMDYIRISADEEDMMKYLDALS